MGLKYEPALDGLRAAAALMVLLHHAHVPGFAGGGRGVDVFFVLSGYLITSLLIESPTTLADFWRRRAVRLMPAMLLMLAAYVTLAPILIPADTAIRWRDAGLSAIYLFNFEQAFDNHETALGHMWSLGVEAQFYLLWPLILPLILRLQRPALWLGGAWVAITVLRTGMLATSPLPHLAYNLPLPHASGLILGAALVFLPALPLASWGFAGIVAACVLPTSGVLMAGGISLAEVATAALILGLKDAPSTVSRGLRWPPLVALGVASYGVYLWHGLILHAMPGPWWFQAPVVMATSIILAAVSHATVERWAKLAWRSPRAAVA